MKYVANVLVVHITAIYSAILQYFMLKPLMRCCDALCRLHRVGCLHGACVPVQYFTHAVLVCCYLYAGPKRVILDAGAFVALVHEYFC